MTAANRVTPAGRIEAIERRGTFLGNRGCLHRDRRIVRPWNGRRWITCLLEYKGWHHEQWAEGRWTASFFDDEAVALAAGHRPCALCRRADYERFRSAWSAAFGAREGADAMDRRLHADRLDGRTPRPHRRPWSQVPDGAFVLHDGAPVLVLGDALRPWTPAGDVPYRSRRPRPLSGAAAALTPAATIEVLRNGYEPVLHPLGVEGVAPG